MRPLDPVWARYRRLLTASQKELTEKSLHELRVQTRRLLAGLEAFVPVAGGPAKCAAARKSLQKRLAALGPLRDAQVHLRDFGDALQAHPEISLLHLSLRRRERRLAKAARAKLDRSGTKKLGRRLAKFSDQLAAGLAGAGAAAVLRRAFAQRLRDAMVGLDRVRRENFRNRRAAHDVRVSLKQLRYGAECLAARARGVTPAELKLVRKCVSALGRVHDIDVQLARLDKLVAKGDVPAGLLQAYRVDLDQRRADLLRECAELSLSRQRARVRKSPRAAAAKRRRRAKASAVKPVASPPEPAEAVAVAAPQEVTVSEPVSSLPG
ncbi:hypothetical protein AYO41_00125 [Verrucomicrobia bacterium SCGC AG-212-E04]|nr:hypothetical protein AYO41_00125 [Verrucomicrobia bacterium SCGC AG-212-E04]